MLGLEPSGAQRPLLSWPKATQGLLWPVGQQGGRAEHRLGLSLPQAHPALSKPRVLGGSNALPGRKCGQGKVLSSGFPCWTSAGCPSCQCPLCRACPEWLSPLAPVSPSRAWGCFPARGWRSSTRSLWGSWPHLHRQNFTENDAL